MKYTFADWTSGHLPEDGPSDEMIDSFPQPPKFARYAPAWGRGSKAAEKAVATRNRNAYERSKETFRREILPHVVNSLDSESLFETGRELRDPELIRKSGFEYYTTGDRGQWLAPNDSRIPQALALGATPTTPENYFQRYP